jgi:hypothetical protein
MLKYLKYFVLWISLSLLNVAYAQVISGSSELKTIEFNNNTQIIENTLPPLLETSSIFFKDANQNNRLDANEVASVNFYIVNKGKGMAKNVKINTDNGTPLITGFSWDREKSVAVIRAGDSVKVSVNLQSNLDLKTGSLLLNLNFNEPMGFAPDPLKFNIQTKEFAAPHVKIVDIVSQSGNVQKKTNITLIALVQNIGQGTAENVKINFKVPENVSSLSKVDYVYSTLLPNEKQQINFEFIISDLYNYSDVSIEITISEKHGRFAQDMTQNFTVGSRTDRDPVSVTSNTVEKPTETIIGSLTSDVDKDIPINSVKNPNKFALIIGNEHYSDKVLNSQIKDVMFANIDATIFREYCEKTLAVPAENIQFILDADIVKMNREINLLCEKIKRKNGQAEIIFYYSGHGSPDEVSKSTFLVPVGMEVYELSQGINVSDFYKKISQSNAKKATVFLDACFTGISETSKFITPVSPAIPNEGKIVVFAATGVSQAAEPYVDKKHGMFTYFLLKKLKETKGIISYKDLDTYLKSEVGITSLNVNRKAQDPQTKYSKDLNENWENWMFYEQYYNKP